MTFDVEIECRVRGRSATNAGPSLLPRPPRCCCGFAAEPRYLCPSVGVMNKCQTSSPSELDPCAHVRRESGGEWRYELVRTKIYYNNVEPTRRERGREVGRDGVVVGLAPRGVGDIAERRHDARSPAPSSLTHWQRPSCRSSASASGRPSERRRRKRASERPSEEESYRGSCGSVQKNWSLSISDVRPLLPPAEFS